MLSVTAPSLSLVSPLVVPQGSVLGQLLIVIKVKQETHQEMR